MFDSLKYMLGIAWFFVTNLFSFDPKLKDKPSPRSQSNVNSNVESDSESTNAHSITSPEPVHEDSVLKNPLENPNQISNRNLEPLKLNENDTASMAKEYEAPEVPEVPEKYFDELPLDKHETDNLNQSTREHSSSFSNFSNLENRGQGSKDHVNFLTKRKEHFKMVEQTKNESKTEENFRSRSNPNQLEVPEIPEKYFDVLPPDDPKTDNAVQSTRERSSSFSNFSNLKNKGQNMSTKQVERLAKKEKFRNEAEQMMNESKTESETGKEFRSQSNPNQLAEAASKGIPETNQKNSISNEGIRPSLSKK